MQFARSNYNLSFIIPSGLLLVLFFACQTSKVETGLSIGPNVPISGPAGKMEMSGLELLKTKCYVCHNPNSPSHDAMLAPPLAGIKWRYRKSYPERPEFVAQMTNFITAPTSGKALMKGPVRRFGVMPPTALSTQEIQQITSYIYDNDLEAPTWFEDHFEEEHAMPWNSNE